MAATVNTDVVSASQRAYAIHIQNKADGTGEESGVNKLNISDLVGPNGAAPTAVTLVAVEYDIQGFSSVQLFWDHNTDDEMVTLGKGQNLKDWSALGGLKDPRTTGGTGDVLLTTVGDSATSTYDITLVFRLEA